MELASILILLKYKEWYIVPYYIWWQKTNYDCELLLKLTYEQFISAMSLVGFLNRLGLHSKLKLPDNVSEEVNRWLNDPSVHWHRYARPLSGPNRCTCMKERHTTNASIYDLFKLLLALDVKFEWPHYMVCWAYFSKTPSKSNYIPQTPPTHSDSRSSYTSPSLASASSKLARVKGWPSRHPSG